MKIVKHRNLSLIDFPHVPATVFWVEGCNFRCPTCHNWDISHKPPAKENNWKEYIKNVLDKTEDWVDGVVISGGEPTIYEYSLIDCCFWLKTHYDLLVCIHTNGSNSWVVEDLLKTAEVDFFCVDIKAPFGKYDQVIGITNYKINYQLEYILDLAKRYPDKFLFRTTKVPTLTDEDIQKIKSYIPEGVKWVEQEYVEVKKEETNEDKN